MSLWMGVLTQNHYCANGDVFKSNESVDTTLLYFDIVRPHDQKDT